MSALKAKDDVLNELWEMFQLRADALKSCKTANSQVPSKALTMYPTKALLETMYDFLLGDRGVFQNALVDGYDIRVGVIGTLKPKDVPERKGINPSTKAKIVIPARRKVTFKASSNIGTVMNASALTRDSE